LFWLLCNKLCRRMKIRERKRNQCEAVGGEISSGDRLEFFRFITCEMHVGGTLLRGEAPFNCVGESDKNLCLDI
jgi:hypothetical protein